VTAQRTFYLLAGPNGAGKSSLYRAALADGLLPADAEFVNADLYEAAHLQHIAEPQQRSEAARAWADERRAQMLAQGRSFISETVFSHPSKLALIAQAQNANFAVVLLVVCLDKPERLIERVRQRISEGGHAVPEQRILDRYPRTLTHLREAVRQANLALLYDNPGRTTGAFAAPQLIATCRGTDTQVFVEKLPKWAQQVLALPASPPASKRKNH
jgi:predicted ABC-type ATPase